MAEFQNYDDLDIPLFEEMIAQGTFTKESPERNINRDDGETGKVSLTENKKWKNICTNTRHND